MLMQRLQALGLIHAITLARLPAFAAHIASDSVKSLPGLSFPVGTQFAGYASIFGPQNPRSQVATNEEIFYWFVAAPVANYRDLPTILWTNGGPGSSSFWGFFLENGPYEILSSKGGTLLKPRQHAWNNFANYLIFEHPLSVTLSFQGDDKDLPADVRSGIRQLYQALLNFMDKHGELAQSPLILAGESYAGTYLPLLSQEIIEGSSLSGALNLQALILMDPWVNPPVQKPVVTEYALNHGLISAKQKEQLDRAYARNNSFDIESSIANISGVSMANIAQSTDLSFDSVLLYLNRQDVRDAIHAKQGIALTSSSSEAIADRYASGIDVSYQDTVQALLDGGLQLIVISGLNDAKTCNFLATQKWLDLLEGDQASRFKAADPAPWVEVDSHTVLGFVQETPGLTWLKVLNAGHLAAADQPLIIDFIMARFGAKRSIFM